MTPAVFMLGMFGVPWRALFAPIYPDEWIMMHDAAVVRHSFFPGGKEYHANLVRAFYGW